MRTLFVWVLLLSSLLASGQTSYEPKPKKGYLGVYFGPSFPVGNFGDSDFNNDESGFAVRGFQYAIMELGIKFIPNFGLAASIRGSSIPMDVQYLADQYALEYGGQFTVESTRWGFGGLHVGPIVTIPVKKLEIDFRLMTGLMFAVSPELTVTQNNSGQSDFQSSQFGTSLALSLGMGLRYNISNRFTIMAIGEYQRARPTFVVDDYPGNNYQSTTVYQNVASMSAMLGVGLRIF
jgi:hypothetical protein